MALGFQVQGFGGLGHGMGFRGPEGCYFGSIVEHEACKSYLPWCFRA